MVMGRKQRMTGDDIVLLLGLEAYNLPDVHSLVAVFTCTFFILSQCIYAVVRRLVILVVLYNPSACGVTRMRGTWLQSGDCAQVRLRFMDYLVIFPANGI